MKYGKGRRVNGKWVFGGVQRESKKCFFRVVESRTKEELLKKSILRIKRRLNSPPEEGLWQIKAIPFGLNIAPATVESLTVHFHTRPAWFTLKALSSYGIDSQKILKIPRDFKYCKK
ncbi:hypothetical protein TNCV_2900331 [Trichonephila clavipes]|nr:hypothetical protein TNCV_2900331 [Trichonephila clavipes]